MRHAALLLGLALSTSACKDESSATPAAAPAADASTPSADPPVETKAEGGNAEGGNAEGGNAEGDDAEGDDAGSAPKRSGLLDLTRDVIDQARNLARDPLRLVPDAAWFAFRVDLPAVLAHPEGKELWQKAEDTESDFRQGMDVVRACLGRLEAVDEVFMAMDMEEHFMLIARGKGLGTDQTWRCFEKEASSRGDSMELEITGIPRGEGPQLRESDKSATEADMGYFPDDDTFVMVAREWDADVRALMDGEGTTAVEGRLAPATKRAKTDDTFFMVGRWEGPIAAALPSPFSGLEDMALSINIEDEALIIDTSIDAGQASDATRVRDELQQQFDQFKGMLGMFGFPGTVAPKIEFVTEGDLVTLRFTLTGAELESIRKGITSTL